MAVPRPQRAPTTGDPVLDRLISEILDHIEPADDRELLQDILRSAVGLVGDQADRLNLKITRAALREMRTAFRAFAPYHDIPKVTIFGSARTRSHDPLYIQACELAAQLAERGWMVVTGAGPGIMAAGMQGAGRERSFGVNIRLPFEQSANEFIVGDEKLVSMKYFFTRKLMLMKESRGFVSLPGGFGTQDESFELLTLQQTGKAEPAPIVLLDAPGSTYWQSWERFVREAIGGAGFIDEYDTSLYLITDDVAEAVAEITGFYRNFHSIRWVGGRLVIRLEAAPTDEELEQLNAEFADICAQGVIERTQPLAPERVGNDRLDKARIVLALDIFRYGRLRAFINALNALPSAPAELHRPPP